MQSTAPVVPQRGSRPAPRRVTATRRLYVLASTRPLTRRPCLPWNLRTALTVTASNTDVLWRLRPVHIRRCWTSPTIGPFEPSLRVTVNTRGGAGAGFGATAGCATAAGAVGSVDAVDAVG